MNKYVRDVQIRGESKPRQSYAPHTDYEIKDHVPSPRPKLLEDELRARKDLEGGSHNPNYFEPFVHPRLSSAQGGPKASLVTTGGFVQSEYEPIKHKRRISSGKRQSNYDTRKSLLEHTRSKSVTPASTPNKLSFGSMLSDDNNVRIPLTIKASKNSAFNQDDMRAVSHTV